MKGMSVQIKLPDFTTNLFRQEWIDLKAFKLKDMIKSDLERFGGVI